MLNQSEVFLELLKIAQTAPANPLQELNQPTPADVDRMKESTLTKKLIVNLDKQLKGQASQDNISSDSEGNFGLKVNDLQNLGKLLQFLDVNKIRINGDTIALSTENYGKLSTAEREKYNPITINLSRDSVTRDWNTADYFANLPSLSKFVRYLQEKAKSDKNKVLEVMIGKLIDQVNRIHPQSGLSRKEKSSPGNPNEIPDEDIVDSFERKVFDVSSPYDKGTQYPLRAKDLKGVTDLNAWMQNGNVAEIVELDKDGKKVSTPYTDPNANRCVALNVLWARASNLFNNSKTTNEQKKYAFYKKKIQDLSKQITGPDGKSCTIGQLSGGSNTNSGKVDNKTDTALYTDTAIYTDTALYKIISAVPLRVEEINFDRIRTFFNLVRAANFQNNLAALENNMLRAETAMNDASANTINNDKIFDLQTDAGRLAIRLQNPKGAKFLPLIDRLEEIVSDTAMVLRYIKSAYEDQLTKIPGQLALILGQVGRNESDNSIYRRNMDRLELYRASSNLVTNYKK